MSVNPPQSHEERRKKRVPARLLIFWTGASGRHHGSISDVTTEGCFINTLGPAEIGEAVSFNAQSNTGHLIELRGTVVHHEKRLAGFGVKFDELSSQQRELLARMVEEGFGMLGESPAYP